MLNIVLFGPPGAGKGTQSEKLIEKHGLVHISTGELLRNEIAAQTELGVQARDFIDHGRLVPDAVVIGMIEHKLDGNKDANGFIFDGFPRTVAQAEALDELMVKEGFSITAMIALDVPREELIERLVKRGETSGRSDDNELTIAKRITEYENKTRPVAEFYQKQGKLHEINGVGGIEEIFGRINEVIGEVSTSLN